MNTAGGDPLYVARRRLAIASEDVGNADPARYAGRWPDCFTRVGPAEGERAIAQAIVYLACAPKSNAVYTAFKAAMSDARERLDYDAGCICVMRQTKLDERDGVRAEYVALTMNPTLTRPGRVFPWQEMAQTLLSPHKQRS
ncbi:hypothetical protein KIF59_19755 [Enterobacter cloacae subsp. cloacae]|nr:hypothetical protein [Enterobacter cloacae subsp. cloacae]